MKHQPYQHQTYSNWIKERFGDTLLISIGFLHDSIVHLVLVLLLSKLLVYRVFRYLRPPLHSQTRHRYMPKLYIFMTLYQSQITMQVFMTIALLTYFRSHVLCVKVIMNDFSLYFWGDFPKMPMKSSIVGSDPYIIPHFKANMSWHALV